MEISAERHRYVVGIVGGAVAGSAAAQILADQGVLVVVFEQNDRPYGKIEDGLPRWHSQQRRNEYERIDARLGHPGVFFVPRTRLGRDIDFDELSQQWGFSALLLANGAWKDRPLSVPDAERFVGHGLIFQNPFIHWFNHKNEAGYTGERFHVPDGTIIVGGGLASIDCVKAAQFEIYERALRSRGHDVSMYDLEHKGIPEICKRLGVQVEELGVRNAALYYRRRVEDMPLAQPHEGATPEQLKKTGEVRRRILNKAQEKYLFEFHECHLPTQALVEGERVVGMRFVRTQVEGRKVTPVPGSETDVRSELTISSIGSIPEPIHGIQMKGEYYTFQDVKTGQYSGRPGVFGVGNVVTGQGNIRVSLEHGQAVATYVVEQYLGVRERDTDFRYLPVELETMGQESAEAMLQDLTSRPPMPGTKVLELLERVRKRQEAIGYTSYAEWISQVTPRDLE